MKKAIILITALFLFFLSGCKSILNLRYNDDDNLKDLKYARIKFLVSESFIRGGFSDHREAIIKEFKEYALDKTNTDISVVFSEETVYGEVLELRINAGLDFDLFLGFEGMQSDRMISGLFKTTEYLIDKGYAMDLTDKIIPDYENLYNRFEQYPILREIGTYNNRLYAIPSGIQKSDRPYILVRDDLWEKYGSEKPIKTLEELYAFTQRVNSDFEEPFYIKTHFNLYDFIEIFAREQGYYILPGAYVAKIDDPQIDPIPIEDTEIIDLASDYFLRLFDSDMLLLLDDTVEVVTILSGNKTAVYLSKNPEEYHYETAGNYPFEYTFVNMYPELGFNIQIPNEVNLMIYENSQYPERVLTILNWLGDSNQAYDILSYGLEDVNYKYKNKRFLFDEETTPSLGWLQRLHGFPQLEKNFATDKSDYSTVVSENLSKAYITPFDYLLMGNSNNMMAYMDTIRLDSELYSSRTGIISQYVNTASKRGTINLEAFKAQLNGQDNQKVRDGLMDLIERLKIVN